MSSLTKMAPNSTFLWTISSVSLEVFQHTLKVSSDSQSLFSTEGETIVSHFNSSTGALIAEVAFSNYATSKFYDVSISPNSSYFICASSAQSNSPFSGYILLIDSTTHLKLTSYYISGSGNQYATQVEFIDDNNYIILSSSFGTLSASETLLKMTIGTDTSIWQISTLGSSTNPQYSTFALLNDINTIF